MHPTRPLRIAISHVTASYAVGGSETYVWALAKFLHQKGHAVRILAGQCENPTRYSPDVPLELFPFRRRERFPDLGKRFRKLMERVSFGWRARHSLLERPCDLLNIHKPYDLPLAAYIKKRTGCKIVWRCHGRDNFATLGHWLKQADAIYCVSEFAHRDLTADYPVPAEVIYTGVDTEFFRPASSREESGPPQVLYFGRLEGWKGIRHLVQAFHELRDAEFLGRIVGEGPEHDALARMIADLGLGSRVRLEPSLRSREGIRSLLGEVDVVVLSSVAVETMSNAMLEAMSMGKAIVATQAGCFAEVLRSNQTAILVEPRSATALARGIRPLLSDSKLRASLGEAARAEAIQRFDANRSFARVEELFRRIVG